MDKKKIKLVLLIVPLLITISALSGCNGPAGKIHTNHWDHIYSDGTAVRIWGSLGLGESPDNWYEFFVYDTEKHDNWEHYAYRVEPDYHGGLNTFSVNIENLSRTTEYHYRAVGEEQVCCGAPIHYGVDKTFIPGGPRVIVHDPSNIGVTSAILEGELTDMGGAASCEVYFIYGTDLDHLTMETTHQTMTSTGNFNAEITGLSSCQKYFCRSVAKNDADTWVSSLITLVGQWAWREFTPGLPIVETYTPKDYTENSATYRGELFELAGTPSCDVWFEYGDDNPNNLDEKTDSIILTAPDQFIIEVEGLKSGTTYWVRAVANNGICEHKGKVKEFTTLSAYGDTKFKERPTVNMKERVQTRIKSLIYKGLDFLGIPEDTPIELIIDSYPILGRLLQNLE